MKMWNRRGGVAAAALIVIAAVAAGYRFYTQEETAAFRTVPVARQALSISINATGTVEPEEVIDVGAQVAGQIIALGTDLQGKRVDYGSTVAAGTVLARIDDSLYAAEAANARAQVEAAEAGLRRAEADLEQLKAKLRQAERDWQRARKLGPSEALAQSTYDGYQSAFETAEANVAVGQAAILQARAGLAQARTVEQRAQRNLGYCTITSPVNGVIIDRRVNIGQTVVASLNAPSLFLIAKDLTRMQVWVAVNEADIGRIHPGIPVSFTVDAFPGETFQGTVGKVRLNAAMTQNVVTYTVEVVTDNPQGRLLPYLTANVRFELKRIEDVLLVPNAALRWQPAEQQIAPEFRGRMEEKEAVDAHGGRPGDSVRPAGGEPQRVIWTPQGGYVRPVRVRAGATDGLMTQVSGEGLTEDLAVVTGIQTAGSEEGDVTNPFTPRFRSRGARSSAR